MIFNNCFVKFCLLIKLLLYADDSAVLAADKDISTVEISLQIDLQTVSEWLIDNKLALHLGKTESILICSKPRLRPRSILNIECKGSKIEPKDKVKYLGAILDQTFFRGKHGNFYFAES